MIAGPSQPGPGNRRAKTRHHASCPTSWKYVEGISFPGFQARCRAIQRGMRAADRFEVDDSIVEKAKINRIVSPGGEPEVYPVVVGRPRPRSFHHNGRNLSF